MTASHLLEEEIEYIETTVLGWMGKDAETTNLFTQAHHGLLLFICISCFCTCLTFTVRGRMRREAPAWLLTVNILPALLVAKAYMFHHKLIESLGHNHNVILFALSMFGGLAIFRSKVRCFLKK